MQRSKLKGEEEEVDGGKNPMTFYVVTDVFRAEKSLVRSGFFRFFFWYGRISVFSSVFSCFVFCVVL